MLNNPQIGMTKTLMPKIQRRNKHMGKSKYHVGVTPATPRFIIPSHLDHLGVTLATPRSIPQVTSSTSVHHPSSPRPPWGHF
ncbi:unnamed protein product [Linum trigynum]|uniref:Uncharacterized protein n=1 Tax=Linum trigynum TaxID=586398 RepID=A0AAV2CX01_9ROSI